MVASAMRGLAQRSVQAAGEIRALIATSVERVDHGSGDVGEAGATMTRVVEAIEHLRVVVDEISRAGVQQSTGVAQVSEAVSQMDQTTQQNAALVEESAAAAATLRQEPAQLVECVAQFRV